MQVERRGGELRDDRQLPGDRRFDRGEIGNILAEREQRSADRPLVAEAGGARQGRLGRRPGDVAPRQRRPDARRLNPPRHPLRARQGDHCVLPGASQHGGSQDEGGSAAKAAAPGGQRQGGGCDNVAAEARLTRFCGIETVSFPRKRESRLAGRCALCPWIPACAGMTLANASSVPSLSNGPMPRRPTLHPACRRTPREAPDEGRRRSHSRRPPQTLGGRSAKRRRPAATSSSSASSSSRRW